MRTAFINSLTEYAREDEKVCLLMAEVGFSVVEGFEKEFPGRFYNTGICEQNLVDTAAGMALKGLKPVAYSMAPFLASRAFEQIKISVCYQDLPVILVGVGTGMAYSNMGATHHAIEDLAIMQSLPNMTVICPCDPIETALAVKQAFELGKPCYFGIGKNRDPILHEDAPDFKIGRAIKMSEGRDVAIIATGGILKSAMDAKEILAEKGLSVKIYDMHTVKPLDIEAVIDSFKCSAVFTLEEHNDGNALGKSVAAAALESGVYPKIFKMLAIPDSFTSTVGGREYQQKIYRIDGIGVAERISEALKI